LLGDKYAATVREATYEFTDASIDRQIVELKATGCNALIAVTLAPFAVQAIRKVRDLGWKPIFFTNSISVSNVRVVLQPAGLESSIGLLSSTWIKDPLDPAFENDPGMKDWRAWMSKYLPGEDVRRPSFVYGYNSAATMVQVLKQAGNDLSRENIMRQATNLRDLSPESPAGRFVLAVVEALQPSESWMAQHLRADAAVRALKVDASPAYRARMVYFAMRDYVAHHPPPGARRGRPSGAQ
jgi:hypothetical protein